jgi:hypothetical protein
MSRLHRTLLAIALFAVAPFARAESLRMVAPAQGASLRGGSLAEVRWAAGELPPSAEEWEAFLSVNGGDYYAFRVTPHLDIALHSFTFVVPNVDTDNARILIRAGNEKNEIEFESRSTFAIEHDEHVDPIIPPVVEIERGEAARPGDPAVIAWTDGARDGSGLTQQAAPPLPIRSFNGVRAGSTEASAELSPSGSSLPTLSIEERRWSSPDRRTPKPEALLTSSDLLLTCRRRNI